MTINSLSFQTNGIARSLSVADPPLHSWSLAFNGTSFVMFDQDDIEFMATVEVDPDTGVVTDGIVASQRIPTEGLFFSKTGNNAQRVTLGLTVGPEAVLDFEATPELVLTIGVSDLLETTTTVVTLTLVDLNDVNEPPVFESVPTPPPVASGELLEYVVPPDSVVDPEGRPYLRAIFDENLTWR
jgi:hypothetical protein